MRRKEFANAYYLQAEKQPQAGRITQVPRYSYKDMRIWHEYFFKYTANFAQVCRGDAHYILDKKTKEQREIGNKLA